MEIKKYKKRIYLLALGTLLLAFFGAYQVYSLDKAHSTFENYYAFRGCTQLISRTDTEGVCRTASGATVKIVKYQGKWFLDGDLPCGFLCF